jgi:glycosyltransferase involved in cell wall biosynthesis
MSKMKLNKNTDFLTIILLCFNRKKYVQFALEAILKQSHQAIKIIVVDNHSTDGTEKILPELIKDDPRASYLRLDSNSNAANSYMKGIFLAQSEFVLVTHDDDILEPGYVSKIVEILKNDKEIGMVASNARLIDTKGELINQKLYDLKDDLIFDVDEYIDYYCENKLWLPTPTLCFRKRIHQKLFVKYKYPKTTSFLDVGKKLIDNEKYHPSGDIEFCVRLNRLQKIYFIAEPQISYRQHSQQESRNVNQWEPMVTTMKNLRKVYKKNIYIYEKIDSLHAKYSIQMYLMKGELEQLRSFLQKESKIKKNDFLEIGKKLYLKNNTRFEEFKFTDKNYELLSSKILKFESIINFISKRNKIILVGSMLISFFIYEMLRIDFEKKMHVIDLSPSRIGQKFLNIKIESYISIFENIEKIEDYLFIITSERERDNSIPTELRSFNEKVNYIFWQDL